MKASKELAGILDKASAEVAKWPEWKRSIDPFGSRKRGHMSDVTTAISSNKPTFVDISNEKYRSYTFPTGKVTIENPVSLNVKRKPEGDSHRVIDANGKAFYIPAGWLMLEWEGKNGIAYSF